MRSLPSADIRADIDSARVNEEVSAWILESIKSAEVTVESEYGTWVTDPTPQVQVPTS